LLNSTDIRSTVAGVVEFIRHGAVSLEQQRIGMRNAVETSMRSDA
jgi:hypothetical protein